MLSHGLTSLHIRTSPRTPLHDFTCLHRHSHFSHILAHPRMPSHVLAHCRMSSFRLTHPHICSHALPHSCTCSHILTHPHMVSYALVCSHKSFALPCMFSHLLPCSQMPLYACASPCIPSHALHPCCMLAHPHLPSHLLAFPDKVLHSIT